MTAHAIDLVPLGVADLQLTRLCFGTGTLFRLHSSRERQRLLDAAYALGIRHFDTARSYGLGDAEREVGRFVARHRGHVTVATKFGMQLSRTGSLLKPLQTAARRVVGMFPGLRKQLRNATLTPAVQSVLTLTVSRAAVRTKSIASPGAETERRTSILEDIPGLPCGIGPYSINPRSPPPPPKRQGIARRFALSSVRDCHSW